MKNFGTLLSAELKKLGAYRFLWLMLAFLLILNTVICYFNAVRDDAYFYLQAVNEAYTADPQAVDAYYAELVRLTEAHGERLAEYHRGEPGEEPTLEYPCRYSGDVGHNDFELLQRYYAIREADEAHKAGIRRLTEAARTNQSELLSSYTWLDESSFAYRREVLTEKLYTDVLNRSVILPETGYGWNQLFDYRTVNLFTFIAVMLAAALIFLSELGKPSLILRPTLNGRGTVAAAKVLVLVTVCSAAVLLFFLSSFLAILLRCGAYSSLSNGMAVFPEYALMPYAWSIAQYAALFIAVKLLVFNTAALMTAALCLLTRNIPLGFFASLAVVASQYLLTLFSGSDMLKYLNPAGMAATTQMLDRFRCFAVGNGAAVPYLPFTLAVLPLLFCALAALTIPLFTHSRLGTGRCFHFPRIKPRCPANPPRRKRTAALYGTGLTGGEFIKTFAKTGTVILILLAVICRAYLLNGRFSGTGSYDEAILAEYMETLGGKPDGDKYRFIERFIEEENAHIAEVTAKYDTVRAAYFAGEIGSAEYGEYLDDYRYAKAHEETALWLAGHAAYIGDIREKTGIEAYFLYYTDWQRLLCAVPDMILVFLIIYICSGIFADEYRGHGTGECMMAVLRPTKRGRKDLFDRKIAFTAATALILSLCSALPELILTLNHRTLPESGAPLVSLEMFGLTNTPITLLRFTAVMLIMRTLTVTALSLLTAVSGVFTKNRLFSTAAAALLIFAPYLLSELDIPVFGYIDLIAAVQYTGMYIRSCSLGFLGNYGYAVCFYAVLFTATALSVYAGRINISK